MIVLPQPSCHNRLKSLNTFSVSLLMKLYNHDEGTIDQVTPLGNDEAISVGEYHFTGQGQNGPIKSDGHWTALYVREGGQWKIRLLTALNDPPRQQ